MAKTREKQQRFITEYLKDRDATQAALRAGYSKKSAYTTGRRLIKNEKIKLAIEQNENQAGAAADSQEVVAFLSAVMRGEECVAVQAGDGVQEKKPADLRERFRAAELLARHYGLLNERTELYGAVCIRIVDDLKGGRDDG